MKNAKTKSELSIENLDKEWTEQEIAAWAKRVMKDVGKIINRQSKYMLDNNQSTDVLIEFLGQCPHMFTNVYDAIGRDIIKWALNENIKKNRALIDKIQAVEKELNLEIHHEW